MNRDNLHGYQNTMVQWMNDVPKCAMFAEMGLGKTIATLTAVADLLNSFEVGRVLIIAPLRVANHTWPEEIRAWEHTRHLTFDVVTGPAKERSKKLLFKKDIHIINRENIPWLVEYLGHDKWPYDMVVIDESSSFKSHQASRFKKMRKVSPKIERMVQLTGTPTSNGLLDLWSQIFLLDKGDRLGRTITGFRNFYFIQDYNGFSYTPRPGMDEKIYEDLQDICLTLAADDYLDMPDRIDNIIKLPMPAKCVSQYKELEEDFVIELENADVEASTAAVLTNKLLQYCNGAMYTDDMGNYEEVHKLKIDALEDIVNESAGATLLVAYNYKSDLERILKKFPEARKLDKSTEVINEWNAGKIKMLCAHPASAGHGLNLQHGGAIIVWFGLNWSLELYQQFNARLHRQGQTKPVFIHHIVIENSVDEGVLKALDGKNVTQQSLLEALKEDIKKRC